LKVNGDGIFDTRPWVRAEGTAQETTGEVSVRFTQKNGNLYAYLLGTPPGPSIRLKGLKAVEQTQIGLLGDPADLEWRPAENDLLVIIDERVKRIANEGNAIGLRINPKPEDAETT